MKFKIKSKNSKNYSEEHCLKMYGKKRVRNYHKQIEENDIVILLLEKYFKK